MRRFTTILIASLAIFMAQIAIHAQTTGSITGTVTDQNGAVVPGATVKIKGAAGQEWSIVTNDSGGYRVPSVANGVYVITISASGFKTSTVSNVKVDVGTPITVDTKLEVGNVGEVVGNSGSTVKQNDGIGGGALLADREARSGRVDERCW